MGEGGGDGEGGGVMRISSFSDVRLGEPTRLLFPTSLLLIVGNPDILKSQCTSNSDSIKVSRTGLLLSFLRVNQTRGKHFAQMRRKRLYNLVAPVEFVSERACAEQQKLHFSDI